MHAQYKGQSKKLQFQLITAKYFIDLHQKYYRPVTETIFLNFFTDVLQHEGMLSESTT